MELASPLATSVRFHCPMQGPHELDSTVPPILVNASMKPSRSIVARICTREFVLSHFYDSCVLADLHTHSGLCHVVLLDLHTHSEKYEPLGVSAPDDLNNYQGLQTSHSSIINPTGQ